MTGNRLLAVTRVMGALVAGEIKRFTTREAGGDLTAKQARARAVRQALEELGPFWVKIGQILSTRPDFVSAVMMKEFEKLHDRVSVAPFGIFEPVLTEDLGKNWRRHFREVRTDRPLGSASLAQVYRVTLKNGQPGVLKVQRPDIRSIVLADMALLRKAARIVGRRFPRFNAVIDVDAMMGVIFDAMQAELDFSVEGANMDQAREAVEEFDNLTVPEVLHASPYVLVETLAPGESIRDVDKETLTEKERLGIGADLLAFMYRSYFLERTFHADPHPGNIFIQHGERASLIDWGMVGRVDRRMSMTLMRILLQVAANDGPSMAKAWVELGRATPWADLPGFITDMAILIPKVTGASLEELNFGVTLTSVLKHSTKRGIQTSPVISLLGKSFANVEGSVRYLAPELSLTAVFEEELRHILIEFVMEALSQEEAARNVMELLVASSASTEQLRGLLQDLAQREFTVRVSQLQRGHALGLGCDGASTAVRALAGLVAYALWLRHRNRQRG